MIERFIPIGSFSFGTNRTVAVNLGFLFRGSLERIGNLRDFLG